MRVCVCLCVCVFCVLLCVRVCECVWDFVELWLGTCNPPPPLCACVLCSRACICVCAHKFEVIEGGYSRLPPVSLGLGYAINIQRVGVLHALSALWWCTEMEEPPIKFLYRWIIGEFRLFMQRNKKSLALLCRNPLFTSRRHCLHAPPPSAWSSTSTTLHKQAR